MAELNRNDYVHLNGTCGGSVLRYGYDYEYDESLTECCRILYDEEGASTSNIESLPLENPLIFGAFYYQQIVPQLEESNGALVQGFRGFRSKTSAPGPDPFERQGIPEDNFSYTAKFEEPDPGSHPIPPSPEILPLIQQIEVVHVNGPDDFFIKPVLRKGSVMSLLQGKLGLWYDNSPHPGPRLQDLVKGGHYVVYSEDKSIWFRAVMRGWKSDGRVRVQLVDDGGILITSVKNVRVIREAFCSLPMQALHATIQPAWILLAVYGSESWTLEEITQFKSDVEGKQFSVMIVKDIIQSEFAPFKTATVVLLQGARDDSIKPYAFGDPIRFYE